MGLLSRKAKKVTKDIPAICDVNLDRYLGTWYEIARFPHIFEKGLENVTATYNIKTDGKIEVINAGLKNGKKSLAKATAWIPDKSCTGELIVRFFWPIKSRYRIIKLDLDNYRYSVVTGRTRNYLWFLSREPRISEELYLDLVSFVSSHGFDTSRIIRVKQAENQV